MTDQARPLRPTLRLTILGATGPTGRLLTDRALEQGHHVVALARRPELMTQVHERLLVHPGDVLEPASLVGAFHDTDAVLSALGARGNAPTTVYSTGVANVLQAMNRSAVGRFVGLSARPVSPPTETTAIERRLLFPVLRRFFGQSYADMARMEAELRRSSVTWTVLRPPRLIDSPATSAYRTATGSVLPHARSITRADLAQAMLDVIADQAFHDRAVAIAH